MIEDSLGSTHWRTSWRALPRRRRTRLLAELRAGEVVRGPEEALLTLREAHRRRRGAAGRALGSLVVGALAYLALGLLLPAGPGSAVDATVPADLLAVLAVVVSLGNTMAERRRLARGIAMNAGALQHWVEHAQLPGPGPLPPEEAARLLRIIDDEGWTRPHR